MEDVVDLHCSREFELVCRRADLADDAEGPHSLIVQLRTWSSSPEIFHGKPHVAVYGEIGGIASMSVSVFLACRFRTCQLLL